MYVFPNAINTCRYVNMKICKYESKESSEIPVLQIFPKTWNYSLRTTFKSPKMQISTETDNHKYIKIVGTKIEL